MMAFISHQLPVIALLYALSSSKENNAQHAIQAQNLHQTIQRFNHLQSNSDNQYIVLEPQLDLFTLGLDAAASLCQTETHWYTKFHTIKANSNIFMYTKSVTIVIESSVL